MITVPDDLGNEVNKFLHHRLKKKQKKKKSQYRKEKFDRTYARNKGESTNAEMFGKRIVKNLHHPMKESWNYQPAGEVPWLGLP